ncbi:hypothetical protein P3S67_002563 [Capsicum chacoense]
MGFVERWIKWIKFDITTVKYSVLVNESPVIFFSPQKGLGHGDPLSSFLFILAIEGHSNMLDKDKQLQSLNGFNIDKSQVLYLNLTLLIFESLSSVIYLVNEVSDLEELAGILGCDIGSFPTTNLGLPLGATFGSTFIWNGVIEKFEKKLASWQMQYLSMGGRLRLINNVLDSVPTHCMTLFPIPSKILK